MGVDNSILLGSDWTDKQMTRVLPFVAVTSFMHVHVCAVQHTVLSLA